jgi:hypothetical protein
MKAAAIQPHRTSSNHARDDDDDNTASHQAPWEAEPYATTVTTDDLEQSRRTYRVSKGMVSLLLGSSYRESKYTASNAARSATTNNRLMTAPSNTRIPGLHPPARKKSGHGEDQHGVASLSISPNKALSRAGATNISIASPTSAHRDKKVCKRER